MNHPKLKIAVLVRNFVTTGGAEKYCVEVTKRLAKKHEVHVFCQTNDPTLNEGITIHKIPRISVKPRWLNQILFSRWCKRETINKFDIIHSHERLEYFDVVTIHCPCYVTKTADSKLKRFLKQTCTLRHHMYKWMEKKQYVLGSHKKKYISVSDYVQKNVQTYYKIPHESFYRAYPGVSIEEVSDFSIRQELKLKEGQLLVLFVGTEFKRKGLDFAIQAISKLENMELMVVGGGDEKTYRNLAVSLNCENRVHFSGLVNNVGNYYKSADIFLLPTLNDPCGMSPLEAMSYQIPVVVSCSKYAGFAEHIHHDECILLDNPRNPDLISEALQKLSDEKIREEYASRGYALAKKITWDYTTNATEKAFFDIIKEKN